MADKPFVPSASQKFLLRQVFEAAEQSMDRAIKAKRDRPEFVALYERDKSELLALKQALCS